MEAGRTGGLVVLSSVNDGGGHFVSGRLLWYLGCCHCTVAVQCWHLEDVLAVILWVVKVAFRICS